MLSHLTVVNNVVTIQAQLSVFIDITNMWTYREKIRQHNKDLKLHLYFNCLGLCLFMRFLSHFLLLEALVLSFFTAPHNKGSATLQQDFPGPETVH